VKDLVLSQPITSVLEAGCGSGVLGSMLLGADLEYRGFDFNAIAISQASERNGDARHFVGDATDPASYAGYAYDGIVCCEVLEHIEDDRGAVALWRPGALCVCSVPNFDWPDHVRYFRSEKDVIDRYGDLIDIQHIERMAKSPATGMSRMQWLRATQWAARHNPRRAMALLGIRQFAWHGGWFIFCGRRR
jgi:2-polyprenyl-3-methyl-5-hydroxy-6-metoxy-1,4-benzoquinol methylase